MGNESRRCARPGCRAWAMRGAAYCRAHVHQAGQTGRATSDAPDGAPETAERGGTAPSSFRERLERGGYRELFERRVAEVLAEAGHGASLADEIGALRLVLARVLAEEEDPAQLASSIPRIVGVLVRAVRAQRTISGEAAEDFTEALTQVLIELGLGGER